MIGYMEVGGRGVKVDFDRGVCVAIPLDFAGPQPCHFGAPAAKAVPMEAGGFVGDTRRGGSCNVPILTLNPHCNGTHTESVAHIVDETLPVHEVVPGRLIPATLVTVTPRAAAESDESYRPGPDAGDRWVTAAALTEALPDQDKGWLEALVVRTLPNGPEKLACRYGEKDVPPYFTTEAADLLSRLGVRHLLVDLPSVDRMHDEGLLTVHHRFWGVPEGTHSLNNETRRERTISEMIYVPDVVLDGRYLLSLHVPAFSTDVAPSRPWLFPVEFT